MVGEGSLAVLALVCGGWVVARLFSREESADLRRVEWLFPVRGRWLRYALGLLLLLALWLCLRQLGRPTAIRPRGMPLLSLGVPPGDTVGCDTRAGFPVPVSTSRFCVTLYFREVESRDDSEEHHVE